MKDDLVQPLVLSLEEKQHEDGDQDMDDSEESSSSHKPVTSIASAYRLLTSSVKVCSHYKLLFNT